MQNYEIPIKVHLLNKILKAHPLYEISRDSLKSLRTIVHECPVYRLHNERQLLSHEEFTKSSAIMNGRRRMSRDVGERYTTYQWSTQSFTLSDIVDNFKLPCVVQCDVTACALNWENFSFDLTQPLLVHSSRSIEKLRARSIQVDGVTGMLFEYGPGIVIPYDYDGWFGVLTDGEVSVRPHLAIESLVKARPDSFLCTSEVDGVVVALDSDGGIEYIQRSLESGEVFRAGDTYVGYPLDSPLHNRSKDKKKHKRKYMKCYDEKDVEILLDYDTLGMFYESNETGERTKASGCEVWTLRDLMKQFTPPVRVQLVHGELPTLMCAFTGILSLNETFVEHTVVAASLDSNNSLMFEISLQSSAKYHISLTDPMTDAHYRSALSLCNADLDSYVSRMKLAFTLHPQTNAFNGSTDISQLSTINVDQSESGNAVSQHQVSTYTGNTNDTGETSSDI